MTAPISPTSQDSAILYAAEWTAAELTFYCFKQVEALLLMLAGPKRDSAEISNELFAHALVPIAERLEMACLMEDRGVRVAEVRLVVIEATTGPLNGDGGDSETREFDSAARKTARAAIKDAKHGIRKAKEKESAATKALLKVARKAAKKTA